MRTRIVMTLALAMTGCGGQVVGQPDSVGAAYSYANGGSGTGTGSLGNPTDPAAAQLYLGREVWVKATFGGQAMFSVLLPSAPAPNNLLMAFDEVLATPRAQRFAQWGVINDPDCVSAPDDTHTVPTGYGDYCLPETYPGPVQAPNGSVITQAQFAEIMGNKSGVVGVRTFPNPFYGAPAAALAAQGIAAVVGQEPALVGVACAGCHAGWNPENPPASTAQPTWDNIHLTIGNQYLQTGKIFAGHIVNADGTPNQADPRWQVFHTWKAGTVDTTAIENDHINNPGIISQFWNVPSRPYFDLHDFQPVYDPPTGIDPSTGAIHVHRGGQGGEDDLGCQMAALRVYFNIGMCAQSCMLPNLHPDGSQSPIDLVACAAECNDIHGQPTVLPAAEFLVNPMCSFMATTTSPQLPAANIDQAAATRGAVVFQKNCASCHSNGQTNDTILSDDKLHPAKGILANELAGDVGTNPCRSKTTNWQTGQIWQAFSSEEQRGHAFGQPGAIRDFPLAGIWSTAPFFHNNQLGPQPDLTNISTLSQVGRLDLFNASMDQLLNPWKRAPHVETTTAWTVIPSFPYVLPPGTPVGLFANVNQATGQNLCSDLVENEGHYFGALLSDGDKHALTEYLKTK